MGHSTFALTLDIYGDFINPEVLASARLARPVVASADSAYNAVSTASEGMPAMNKIEHCHKCPGVNQPSKTQATSGYGSVRPPAVAEL
jgi:hypothetical protein